MNARISLLIGLTGLVPFGIAVAEQVEAPPVQGEASAGVGQLLALSERVLTGIGEAQAGLQTVLNVARRDEDMILATCLQAKLEEVMELENEAALNLDTLRSAPTAEAARLPYVVITVIGQKADLVVEEAALCVAADEEQSELDADTIAAPVDPQAVGAGGPFDVAQPPVTRPFKPLPDLPMAMPPVPPTASPVR